MARKGKNKKKQKKYSKKQFVEIVCSSCNICEEIGKPIFCYDSIYKINPKKFPKVLENLLHLHKHLKNNNKSAGDINIEQFSNTFCNTGICNNQWCPLLPDCYDIFLAQVENEGKVPLLGRKVAKSKQKHKGKKQKRYVCHAYPTFFSSNNEKFKTTVERILHGDNTIKQDNDKKPIIKTEKLSCRKTQGKEPQVS